LARAFGGSGFEELRQDVFALMQAPAQFTVLLKGAAELLEHGGTSGWVERIWAVRGDPDSLSQTDQNKRYLFGISGFRR